MISIEIEIAILVLLLALSALFSGTEAAFISLDRLKLRRMVKKGKKNAKKAAELKKKSDKVLSALLIGNNLVNVLASVFATMVMLKIFGDYAIGMATGIMTFMLLVFGEITPKRLAIRHAEFVMSVLANKIALLTTLLTPLIWLIEKISGVIISFFGGGDNEKNLTEEEVRSVISMGAEEGAINKREQEMIHRIFKLNDIPVEEIMTPRIEVAAVEGNKKLEEIASVLKKSTFSRIPVYEKNMDHVIGILYVKDALKYLSNDKGKTMVSKLMKGAYFIPNTKKIDKLLREFQDRKEHLAMVVDEYGGIQGVVTIEDVLEEIVGEIEDEEDAESPIKKVDVKEYLSEGTAEIREINRMLGTNYNPKEYDTLAGMIMAKIDRIPKKKEKIVLGNMEFIVKKLKGPKIQEVQIFDKR